MSYTIHKTPTQSLTYKAPMRNHACTCWRPWDRQDSNYKKQKDKMKLRQNFKCLLLKG
jgi:hypothetical protein